MSKRIVNIDGQEWEVTIGKSNTKIRSPKNKSTIVDHSKLTGKPWSTIERGQWKRTSDGMITPKDVETYIRKYLLK